MPTFKAYYRAIRNTENVDQTVSNRGIEDVFQNTLWLRDQIASIAAGKALTLVDQPLDPRTAVGMPVYRAATGVWTPAWSELSSQPNSTLFALTEKAECTGVVSEKLSAGIGTITLAGQVTLTADVLDLIDGTYREGIVYLSGQYPGFLATNPNTTAPVRVGVLTGPDTDGDYLLIVNPEQRAQLESHGHLKFDLTAEPAGVPNCVPGKRGFLWGELEPDGPYPGVIHVVDAPDTSLPGWLPIDSPVFDGLTKPTGAKFGYNILQDTELLANWPPMPIDNVVLTVDGVAETGDLVQVNLDGIWWMDDQYGKAPWPVNTPCGSSTVPGSSSSSDPYPIWPLRIELWITKVTHGTTLTALNQHIEAKIGVEPELVPVAVGTLLTQTILTGTNLQARVLPKQLAPSSSSSTGVDENALHYQVSARQFSSVAGRQPTVQFELVLAGNEFVTISTIDNIINGLSASLSRAQNTPDGFMRGLDTVVTEDLAWDLTDGPFPMASSPRSQYFCLRTAAVSPLAQELLALKIAWNGTVLNQTSEAVWLLTVRPIVSYPG